MVSAALTEDARSRASRVRLLVTDCDGVLTDGSVYYSARGEELKRFLMRDGMGVDRLRRLAGIETAIVTGERSAALCRRAAKLAIRDVVLGADDKAASLEELAERYGLRLEELGYLGDDVNDLGAIERVGFASCPSDAMAEVAAAVHYVCMLPGGRGAFREVAELLIEARTGSS